MNEYARENMFHARNLDTIVCLAVQILTSLNILSLNSRLVLRFQ